MTDFEALLACYRSGQVSERQWQAHLEDKAFRAWVEDQLPVNYPRDCSGRDNPGQEGAESNHDQEAEARE